MYTVFSQFNHPRRSGPDRAAWEAGLLYTRAMQRAWLAWVRSLLTGRRDSLLDPGIAARLAARRLHSWTALEPVQTVPIDRIVGSLQPGAPFDRHFLPQNGHCREKWLQEARGWVRGLEMAPVELLAVEQVFLVRDGLYRISVASALGQRNIDGFVWALPITLLTPAARQAVRAFCASDRHQP